MIKYVNNSFHALKVVFANEIAALCHSMGVDPHTLMDLFVKDRHLNIPSAYRPVLPTEPPACPKI